MPAPYPFSSSTTSTTAGGCHPMAMATEVKAMLPPAILPTSPAITTRTSAFTAGGLHHQQPTQETAIASSGPIREHDIEKLVQQQGYTKSLARSLNQSKDAFALRIWIVDNSGSMQQTDGHRIVGGGGIHNASNDGRIRMVSCSRWEEIRECVEYHIRLASMIEAPTRFRLLNHPGANIGNQEFSIAEGREDGQQCNPYELQEAIKLMQNARPSGCTPLTDHMLDVHRQVSRLAPQLRGTGQRVALIIATDGLPTNEQGRGGEMEQNQFVESLRMLEGLPVWVVIRLCTDEQRVVDFYNDLDSVLELSIDVLDDFSGEATEVRAENPWLNYCLPLHRMREMGYHDRLFDLIDERSLTKSEIRDFCALVFGDENFDGVPDPSVDWKGFIEHLSRLADNEKNQWNPISKKHKPWISVKKLNRIHGGSWFGKWFGTW